MKTLIVGCGGIGSWLINEIAEAITQGQIDFHSCFDIVDNDIIECKNVKFQNFKDKDIGKNKALQLSKRYGENALISPIQERIISEEQLKGYDLIICCADNTTTRYMIFEYCHKNNIQFIDLRARGRYIMALQKSADLRADLDTLDLEDTISGSCQTKEDLEQGILQMGNKIVAVIGCQMLLNFIRGIQNSKILMRI